MEQQSTILEGSSAQEKAAYLGAIASLATADRQASEEELEFLDALCQSANLTEEEAASVRQTASTEMTDEELKSYLDVLKGSELRFPFMTHVMAFAQADQNYSDEEQQNVKGIAAYLGVNDDQFSVLDQFTKKAAEEAPNQSEAANTSPQGFLDSLGFGDKLKGAGINTSSLMKGAIGILGPLLLSKVLGGGRNRTSGGGGGLLGGLLGGGGGGGLLGGLLGGGSGFSNAGGMLGRIFGGRGM